VRMTFSLSGTPNNGLPGLPRRLLVPSAGAGAPREHTESTRSISLITSPCGCVIRRDSPVTPGH
jgi:hypothetical protein